METIVVLALVAAVQINSLELSLMPAPPDTVYVILEAVFTANHLTDTDRQNSTGKYTN